MLRTSRKSFVNRNHTIKSQSSSSSSSLFRFSNLKYSISVDLIKQLRQETGAPLGQCKSALKENSGDLQKAKEWLREKGVSSAAKKSGRRAAEGLAGVLVSKDGKTGCVIEVNSETDFVARNELFQNLVRRTANAALTAATESEDMSVEQLSKTVMTDEMEHIDVETAIKQSVGVIGENLQLRRVRIMHSNNGSILFPYVHNASAPNVGKIATLVKLKAVKEIGEDKLKEMGMHIAMHVTAFSPQYLKVDDVPSDVVDKEREVLEKQSNGNMRAVEGRLRKFFGEIVLEEQPWILDQKKSVSKAAKEAGVVIEDFERYMVGEGL